MAITSSVHSMYQRRALRLRSKNLRFIELVTPVAKLLLWTCIGIMCLCFGFAAVYEAIPAHEATIQLKMMALSVQDLAVTSKREVQVNGDEAHRLLLETGLTAMQARIATTSQRKFWDEEAPILAEKGAISIDNLNAFAIDAKAKVDGFDTQGISSATIEAVNNLNTQFTAVGNASTATANTMTAAGKILGNPNIPPMLLDTRDSLHSIAGMAQHGDSIMDGLNTKVNSWLHPTFWRRMEGIGLLGLDLVGAGYEIHYYSQPSEVIVSPTVKAAHTLTKALSKKPAIPMK